jgi:AAA domain
MSAYPEGFDAWPLDRRNALFAQQAKAYADERKRANGKNHPASFNERNPPPIGESPGDRAAELVDFRSAFDFCSAYEPIAYAVEPFIRSGSLYTLTAKTGAGKTAILIVMALAVVTGRGDILGREVTKGRVAFIAVENPDDLRMKLMVAAYILNINFAEIAGNLIILDKRVSPESLAGKLKELSADGEFRLITVDTLAAYFDGDDINNNVQAGNFMRRLRPMTHLPGAPSVIVAAHPVKNAAPDNLIPYGGGAILNEADGNLTLRRGDGGATELHWQGKLRGVEFEPAMFRFELLTSPDVKDVKDREVQLPVLMPLSAQDAAERDKVAVDKNVALLKAMAADPSATIDVWSTASGAHPSWIKRALPRLALPPGKLVVNVLGKWTLTPAGVKAIEGR